MSVLAGATATSVALTAVAVLTAAAGVDGVRRWQGAARVRGRLAPASPPVALPLPRRVRSAFERAGLGADAHRLVLTWLAALALAALLALATPGGRIILAAAAGGGPVALHLLGGRTARRRRAQLPVALDAVASGLRGGIGLAAAIGGAASVGPPLDSELAAIAREVDGGRPLTDALARWRHAAHDEHTGLAAAALSVAAQVGGPGARAVDGAAASLRDRLGADAETSALATQGRTSAVVLTIAPIGFAVLLATLDPRSARFLLGTPVGWLCIGVGLGLDAVGAWWMGRLVARAR